MDTTEKTAAASETVPLDITLREFLKQLAREQRVPIIYRDLAVALDLSPPHTIQQLTSSLERLMTEDASQDRPLIAALVIAKARSGLPGAGFFDCAQRAGLYSGSSSGADAEAFHTSAFRDAITFWSAQPLDAQPMVD